MQKRAHCSLGEGPLPEIILAQAAATPCPHVGDGQGTGRLPRTHGVFRPLCEGGTEYFQVPAATGVAARHETNNTCRTSPIGLLLFSLLQLSHGIQPPTKRPARQPPQQPGPGRHFGRRATFRHRRFALGTISTPGKPAASITATQYNTRRSFLVPRPFCFPG